jgi:hypothetical protein
MKRKHFSFFLISLLLFSRSYSQTQVTLTVMAPMTICIGQCISLTATAAGGTPPYTYTWSVNGTPIAPANVCPTLINTTYTVTVSDSKGATATPGTVRISLYPPLEVVSTGDRSICSGGQASLNAVASGSNGGPYTFSWYPSAGLSNPNIPNPIASPTVTTTYWVVAYDGCMVDTAYTTITLFPKTLIAFTSMDSNGCAPLCCQFMGVSVPSCATATWSFGDGTTGLGCSSITHCYTLPGSYTPSLSITDINGCAGSLSIPGLIDLLNCTAIQNSNLPSTGLQLYPNPFVRMLTVVANHLTAQEEIVIYDLTGRVVYSTLLSEAETVLDLNGLAKGVYFLKAKTGKEVLSMKIEKL